MNYKTERYFGRNRYDKFFDKYLQIFLNKIYSKKARQDTFIFSSLFRKILNFNSAKITHGDLPFVKLKLVFRIKNRLCSKFTFREKISKEICSLLCYKFQCSSCSAIYYGKTNRHFQGLCLGKYGSLGKYGNV